jgi:hypothetical protein
MNYERIYESLILRAKTRKVAGYIERHHVIPKCMGGGDEEENIVSLTPEEHYVCHQLLVRIFPKNPLLAYAASHMANRCSGRRAYGWLRRRRSKSMSLLKKGNKNCLGRKMSEATRAKISAANKGHTHLRGIRKSAAHRANIALSKIGVKRGPMSSETKAKISKAKKGRLLPASWRASISLAQKKRRERERLDPRRSK